MNPFNPPRIDRNLAPGQRLRQSRNQAGIELEGQRLGPCRGKGISPERRFDKTAELAQQPIIVDRSDLGEARPDRVLRSTFGLGPVTLEHRIMARHEQRDHAARYNRGMLQGIDRGRHRIVEPGLPQIAIPRPQPVGLPCTQRRCSDKAVERIIFGVAVEHFGNRGFDLTGTAQQRGGFQPGWRRQYEIVDRPQLAAIKLGRHVFDHPEAEILQRGNGIRQRQ